jgi:hypothetical protein
MITVRQIQRFWQGKAYDRVLAQLLACRSESSPRLVEELNGIDAAAAMLIIRLDELSQVFAPLYSEAVRTLLQNQRPDGSWGDTITTAIALRALLCGNGHGSAIERGMRFLANLQKSEGIWPCVPVRRMPVDPFASAFVLVQLGNHASFHQAIRFIDAREWFIHNELALDEATRKLWWQSQIYSQPTVLREDAPQCAELFV